MTDNQLKVITLRLSLSEYDEIVGNSHDERKSMNQYIRDKVFADALKEDEHDQTT